MAQKRNGKAEYKNTRTKIKITIKQKTENMNLKVMLKALLDLKMSEVITDKATLIYDADILEEGVEVFVQDPENADKVIPAEDGEYTIEEEKKIVVVKDGKVAEIKEMEQAEETTETTETTDTTEVVEAEVITETPAEDPIAEEVTEETEDDKRLVEILNTVTELTNRLSALEGKLTEMEERLSKVEGEPAAEPIEDENKPAEEEVKASRLSYLKKK